MSDLVDRLTRLSVNVTSPNGIIGASIDSERYASFLVQDHSSFDHLDAATISREISTLMQGMFSGLRHGVEKAYQAEGREYVVDDRPAWDAAWRRFYEAAAKIEPLGVSSSGLVALFTNDTLSDWEADVDDEVIDTVEPEELVQQLKESYSSLLADWRRKRRELRLRHIGR